jgi:hypothetical protein
VDNDGWNLKLPHALLKLSYLGDPKEGCILKCAMANPHDPADTCIIMYQGTGKCEMTYGFEHALGFSNQVANEKKVCDMLATIETSTCSKEAGEIFVLAKSQDGVVKFTHFPVATAGQKFDLVFLILGLGIVVLGGLAIKMRNVLLPENVKGAVSGQYVRVMEMT